MKNLHSEMISWTAAVEAEMARLIRLGVPPYDAAIQARQRIERQRRDKAADAPEAPGT